MPIQTFVGVAPVAGARDAASAKLNLAFFPAASAPTLDGRAGPEP
jgi:hypothetical protein